MKTQTHTVTFFIRLGDCDPAWNGFRIIQTSDQNELRAAANQHAQAMSEESGVSRDRVTWRVSE